MKKFDNLILCGRGGSGKSEFIDFIKHLPLAERLQDFHIGDFKEIDDFPWLHAIFKDEDIWQQLGRPRRLSKKEGEIYMSRDNEIYKFLMLKFNAEIRHMLAVEPDLYDKQTVFIEFARGGPCGYRESFELLDESILKRSAVFYLDNTFEESLRRNEVRSKSDDPNQSVLHHKVPLETMEKMYKNHDWYDLTNRKTEGYVNFKGFNIPFVSVWNIPESHDPQVLEERYGGPLKKLWELYETF